MRQEWYPAVIIAAIIAGGAYALHSDFSGQQNSQREGTNTNQPNNRRLESRNPQQPSPNMPPSQEFIDTSRSGNDRASQQPYTEKGLWEFQRAWWNFVFTGILAIVGIIQSRLLYHTLRANRMNARAMVRAARIAERASKITKIAADAARDSADALPALERAYIFVQINSGVADWIRGIVESEFAFRDKVVVRSVSRVPIVGYRIINHGKTPAIVRAMSADFTKSAALANLKYEEEAMSGEIIIAAGESFPPAAVDRPALITYSGPSRIIMQSANLPKMMPPAKRRMSRLTERSPKN